MKWIEIALGSARHNGTVIQETQLSDYVKKAQNAGLELYKSIFSFDEGIVEHMKTRKSPSGYEGTKYLDTLTFDIDKGQDSDKFCHHRAKVFADKLIDDWGLDEDLIHFYYSGRGYHIVTPDLFGFEPSPSLPKTVKLTLDSCFPEADTIFYHHAGLIRVCDTVNLKTGRFKVYLSYEEMYDDVEKIFELAKKPRSNEPISFPKYEPDGVSRNLIKREPVAASTSLDLFTPSKNAPCFQSMYSLGEEEGTRHIRIIRMSAHYRKQGIPFSAAVAAMQSYAPSLSAYEIEKQVKSVYDNEYSWGCNDDELKKFCSPTCIYFKDKDYAPALTSALDLEKQYVKYSRTDFGHKAFDFAELYNLTDDMGLPLSCQVPPETFVLIFGDSGLGKTAVVQNLACLLPMMKILYISTEFGLRMVYRRFIQVSHNMTKHEVDAYYRDNSNTLSDSIKHITFFGKGMSTTELISLVKKLAPDLVIVDVVDGIEAPGKEVGTVANDIEVVKTFRKIIEEEKTILLGVHHLSKASAQDKDGKPRKLTLHSGKGGSVYEQKADIVLGLEGDANGSVRSLSTLKHRDIDPFRTLFTFNKTNFQFNQLKL